MIMSENKSYRRARCCDWCTHCDITLNHNGDDQLYCMENHHDIDANMDCDDFSPMN